MKATQLLIFAVITLCSIGTVHAEDEAWYAGVKAGSMKVDVSAYDDELGVGGVLGYKLNNTLAIEGGYSTTGKDGGLTIGSTQGNWSVDIVSVYLAYRSEGALYFKGKIRYLYEDVKITVPGASLSGSDNGITYGIGAGWRPFKNISFELEYTAIEADLNFISFGINFGI